jgi:hypothetical protein
VTSPEEQQPAPGAEREGTLKPSALPRQRLGFLPTMRFWSDPEIRRLWERNIVPRWAFGAVLYAFIVFALFLWLHDVSHPGFLTDLLLVLLLPLFGSILVVRGLAERHVRALARKRQDQRALPVTTPPPSPDSSDQHSPDED